MKPSMIFALVLLTAIVLMSVFGVHLSNAPFIEADATTKLFICPVDGSGWDSAAKILQRGRYPILIAVFGAFFMILFSWGWALYQNLLKDKFNDKAFKNSWGFTKIWFWAVIILLLLVQTPNHFKTVHIRKHNGELYSSAYVLCEQNTTNSWENVGDGKWPKAVPYSAVVR